MEYLGTIDYETYSEIMSELGSPINAEGLDLETLKRLYESKAVYLENLRVKCFLEINSESDTCFTSADYSLILNALNQTKKQIRSLIFFAVSKSTHQRKAS